MEAAVWWGEELASLTAFLCCHVRACVETKAVLALSGDLSEHDAYNWECKLTVYVSVFPENSIDF